MEDDSSVREGEPLAWSGDTGSHGLMMAEAARDRNDNPSPPPRIPYFKLPRIIASEGVLICRTVGGVLALIACPLPLTPLPLWGGARVRGRADGPWRAQGMLTALLFSLTLGQSATPPTLTPEDIFNV